LIHKSRGRKSKSSWDEIHGQHLIELYTKDWFDFGPTFASEKLNQLYDIRVSKETVRQSLALRGLWQPKQQKIKHRSRRERKSMRGIMIQLDGSPHDWFEGRSGASTLLVFIDDATSQILWLEFVKSESIEAVMQATLNYIKTHGIPHSFYVDHGSVFSVNLNNAEREKITQWERSLKELGVTIIHAHSPQAKGRVERCNQTMQDRLVKELRLANISSIEEGNRFLLTSDFIQRHNDQFAVPAAQNGNAHRSIEGYNLGEVFTIREIRVLANDFTITFNKRIFQLHKQQRTIIRPKNEITVCTRLDGFLFLRVRSVELAFTEIVARSKKEGLEIQAERVPRQPSENSRRWAGGLSPLPSRMKPALPAVEAFK
jgi:hypothetical protein